ncbi:MAG: hypothetical protein K1X79_02375 [Oligoflexia bacterium]|nr:hypothetical protein [Oligoflexia bacterium]
MAKQSQHTDFHSTLGSCLKALFVPIARLCLRRSLKVQDAIESLKHAFLEVAEQEVRGLDEKPNVSRLSAITGLHRRDVVRIFRMGESKDYSLSLNNRIIGQWLQDPRFLQKNGKPRVLSVDGEDSDFRMLMRSIATDLKPGTVLFELERVGAVERSPEGLKLVVQSYQAGTDPVEGFQMLGDDLEDLVSAVDDNLFEQEHGPHLHAKTVYDNVNVEALPLIRKWILKEGKAFHKRARQFLSRFDLDVRPRKGKMGGAKIAVGTFSRVFSGKK